MLTKSKPPDADRTTTVSQYGFRRAKIRAIVVDDMPNLLNAICDVLEIEGQVEVVGRALCGEDAVLLAAELSPEIVLMDVNMPGVNGLEAASILSEHFPSMCVILMSGEDSQVMYERAQASGAHAFFGKAGFPEEFMRLMPLLFPEGGRCRLD